MNINFATAIDNLGADTVFRLANQSRPSSDYLFNELLPEETRTSYEVSDANMQITATMAGLAAEDGPYPSGGHVSMGKLLEKSAKIASDIKLTEGALREMQEMLMRLQYGGNSTNDFIVNELLNFTEKVVIQGHMDTMEYLRGQTLVNGAINWTFGNQTVNVDYGVPAANKQTKRTGTDAYDQSSSKFWDDVRWARKQLKYNVRAVVAHPDTITAILAQNANSIEVLQYPTGAEGVFRFRRLVGSTERPSTDQAEQIEVISYGMEGELIDPANPDETINIPFMPQGKLLFVANNRRSGYRVGEGSTPDPEREYALGYTHLAPTVEGGGVPGRYARLYTPENQPYSLRGQGVTNGLPVLEAPAKVAILSTEIDGA